MKKSASTPNLPMSSRMQMAAGSDKTSSVMAGKGAMKGKGASKKMMAGASKKAMPAKKGY
jgi:hypothetical protein